MTDAAVTGGQATADSSGTTAGAPAQNQSPPVGTTQTTAVGPGNAEESFFDPASIAGKPELELAYKQMQGAWTKGMQKYRAGEQKITAYDAFLADPMGTLKQVAQQYGLHVVQPDQNTPQDFNPNSWDDVEKHFFEKFQKKMEPVFNEVKSLKKQNVETFLDTNHPDWRTYENDMMGLLKTHPTLVNDPGTLYRLAVPSEVLEQRAAKAALQKLKATNDTTQASGSANVKHLSEPTIKPGPNAFQQSIEAARKKLEQQGIRRVS